MGEVLRRWVFLPVFIPSYLYYPIFNLPPLLYERLLPVDLWEK